jgi:hypothetical protein
LEPGSLPPSGACRRLGIHQAINWYGPTSNFKLLGKLYADAQADSLENEPAALAKFHEWTRRFAQHVGRKGVVRGVDDAARSAKSTTQ